jgi:hypothetical protein
MVLALSVMATPASANVTAATVVPVTACAGATATYTITFDVTADLLEGDGSITINFPDDTGVAAITSITVENPAANIEAVPTAWITVGAGAVVTFLVPMHIVVATENTVIVVITGVVNPSPGSKTLTVNTSAAADATPVASGAYVITPAISTYDLVLDFDDTYAGIALDFVPPFKACGQVDYGYSFAGGWMTHFDLILDHLVAGCAELCTSANMWFVLEECAAGGVVTLDWDNLSLPFTYTLDIDDVGDVQALPAVLLGGVPIVWDCGIHFSVPGDYEICWYIECTVGTCTPGKQAVASRCLEAVVHQWKDAGTIVLDEKWNLISLPLVPFDTDIAVLLESLDAEAKDGDGVDDLISIWNYSDGTWTFPVTTMVDGKSYWVRMSYPITASPAYTWWVWGTARAMPPLAPSAYAMNLGWNMFGFTSLTAKDLDVYLWNFVAATPKPLVYGWKNTGSWLTSDWEYHPFGNADLDMVSGQGYWGYFPTGGTVVP